jgi:hypothetical protein
LGEPERFADELRAAAGFPPATAAAAARSAALDRGLAAVGRAARHPVVRELAPLWWLARGYLVVVLLAMLTGASWAGGTYGFMPIIHDARMTILVLLAACAGSIALGALWRRGVPRWFVAANLLLLAIAGWMAVSQTVSNMRFTQVEWEQPEPAVQAGLIHDGLGVGNIYAYDRRGRLLQDVRLFDDAGRPLDIGNGEDPHRRVPVTKRGEQALNAFPIRYFEPGTRRVAHPNAGAPPRPAPIVTKPVR